MKTTRRQRGFSLIELLIVVAIIGIIAAIAIPNLLAARRSANDASAIQTLRNLNTAQVAYQQSTGQGNFAATTPLLGPTGTGMLDISVVNSGPGGTGTPKSGYLITNITAVAAAAGVPASYTALNVPAQRTTITRTGNDSFWVDDSGVIRHSGDPNMSPTVTSNPIGS